MSELIEDLKEVIARHESKSEERLAPSVFRWIPICEGWREARWAELCETKGGDTVTRGKNGKQVKVLAWVQVLVGPYSRTCGINSIEWMPE